MARVPNLPCADCGKLMWSGTKSLSVGQARCQPCRAKQPTAREMTCEECGTTFFRKRRGYRFCSLGCTGAYNSRRMQVRPEADGRVKRTHREHAAPGLSRTARDKLRATWKRQNKPCAYCGQAADTVDHIMPLVLGGTNWEGNLAPACRRCNSSKSGMTLMQWRTKPRVFRNHT